MKRFIKYGVLPIVTFLFLLSATIMVLPVVINVQKFIPEIEEKLSAVTGRSLSIGSNLGLSFFPWLSISFSDLKIDNPKGYLSDGFIKIESFEARIKLLPLLKKEVEISRFIIGGLEVNLEKRSDGKVNWDFSSEDGGGTSSAVSSSAIAEWALPEGLTVGLFAVTDGTVLWSDRTHNSHHRLNDLMLVLNDVTLNDPVAVEFKASIEGKSLAAEGTLGPLGKQPGEGVLPVDLAVSLNNTYTGQINGTFIDLVENFGYELDLHVPSFAVRELFTSLAMEFPFITADPTAFEVVEIDIAVKGDKEKVILPKGTIKIDETLIDIIFEVKDFDHLDLGFALDIDRLNLDRYLPPDTVNNNERNSPIQSDLWMKDYSTFRKINLAGTIKVKDLAVGGGTVNDLRANLRGADGIFAIDPSSFVVYQGRAESTLTVDLQSDIPQTTLELKAEGIQALPLLQNFLAQDFMSGTVDTDVRLLFSGNGAEAIRTSLYADGTLRVKDGTLEGIDMVKPIRNIAALPASGDSSIEKIRTDFSEIKSIFTIRNGLVASSETTLDSIPGAVLISGTADLVSEKLELVVEPEFAVAMDEEQGTEGDSSGGSVPFAISGTFGRPKIDIEAKYLSLDELDISDESDMQLLVDEKLPSPDDEDVKDLAGTALVDAAAVAQRFGLEPALIPKNQLKIQFPLGTGRIKIRPLQQEDALR